MQEARKGGRPFVFFEGPPTANGRPGIHHVFSRTIKDLFCRYQAMQGRSVTRIAGWDTHGLPVEIEVEKKLALSGKKDIEAYGVAEFNRLCRESVFTYQKDWVELSDERRGRSPMRGQSPSESHIFDDTTKRLSLKSVSRCTAWTETVRSNLCAAVSDALRLELSLGLSSASGALVTSESVTRPSLGVGSFKVKPSEPV